MSAPSKHLSVFTRSPALLGQGGRWVCFSWQAIPGLSKTASASLPRPRLRAAIPPCPVMLGAARRGGTSKAKSEATSKAEVPLLGVPQPSASSPRRRGFSSANLNAQYDPSCSSSLAFKAENALGCADPRPGYARSPLSPDVGVMTVSTNDVSRLVDMEIARASSLVRAALMRRLLVAPRNELRSWDYGLNVSYPCWIVGEHHPSNTAFAYCEQGFGPRCPWGLLNLSGEYLSMGMDSGWFSSMEDAVMDSFAADEI
jgi:hypothetical protein